MASAIGFAIDAAGIITALSLAFKPSVPEQAKTNVQLILGSGSETAGGKCPHIALWDKGGDRIGQYSPDDDCSIEIGSDITLTVDHYQTEPKYKQVDPYYVMISQMDDDAICIASIAVMNTQITGSFYGDTGWMCGQSWFHSKNEIGPDFATPRCVWLDRNHDNKINAAAISFHVRDMMPNEEKMASYKASNFNLLCKSSPRFSFWGNLLPDGVPPFFEPPLEYKHGNGADKDPKRVLDDPKHPVDKGVYLHQGEPKNLDRKLRTKRAKVRGANHDPDHLIVSDHRGQSARDLCESKTSYGWDFVSTVEGLFCDMEHKKLYKLCSGEVTQNCFDLEKKNLRDGLKTRSGDAERLRLGRTYKSSDHWKPKERKRKVKNSMFSWF